MPAARTSSITEEMTKFMNTTIWLREARERLGGGVPASGRKASAAVFGTIDWMRPAAVRILRRPDLCS
ncbi:hypothetical protein AJ88_29650 [Mesorhizobium amorphae CCBAU 01583]|nr:hypothetical protein AJ88_29650 [Mesorhizobium amorphae CCBAU 01583]